MKPVPVSAVVAWGLVTLIAGVAVGATVLPREIQTAGPEVTVTETRTETTPVPSPVRDPTTPQTCRAAINAADDVIDMLRRALAEATDGSFTEAAFYLGRADTAEDRYTPTSNRCFES